MNASRLHKSTLSTGDQRRELDSKSSSEDLGKNLGEAMYQADRPKLLDVQGVFLFREEG